MRRSTFLFASTPITAHTINLVPIAARLIGRGHRVLWYAARRFHDRIAGVGAEPYGFTEAREFADLEAAYGGAGSLRAIAGLRQGFADQLVGDAARRVRDLEGIAAGTGSTPCSPTRCSWRPGSGTSGAGRCGPASGTARSRTPTSTPRRTGRACCRCAAGRVDAATG